MVIIISNCLVAHDVVTSFYRAYSYVCVCWDLKLDILVVESRLIASVDLPIWAENIVSG